MKSKIWIMTICSSLALFACGGQNGKTTESDTNSAKVVDTEKEVPYKIAERYFVKNTFHEDQLTNPKIESQEKLEEIFGVAAVMGPNGMPTKIDFSKEYAIAYIGKVTNEPTTYKVRSLVQKTGTIELDLAIETEKEQSYTMQPNIIVIVDKKYEGPIEIVSSK